MAIHSNFVSGSIGAKKWKRNQHHNSNENSRRRLRKLHRLSMLQQKNLRRPHFVKRKGMEHNEALFQIQFQFIFWILNILVTKLNQLKFKTAINNAVNNKTITNNK